MRLLKSLNHGNIVRFIDVFECPEYGFMYLVIESMDCSLSQYLKNKGALEESEAVMIFKKIAEAVNYCHQKGVIHFDLKPENVLLNLDLNG